MTFVKKRYAMWWYAVGAVAARTGDEMSGPALLLAGLAVTGSASTASWLLAGITVSAAIGGPVFGVLLDRAARPGRLLAWALGLYAVGLAAVLAGLGRVPLVATILIAVCAGLLGPALSGGWTSQLPRVATGGRLPRANALDAMTFNLASLVGPALAGVVAGVWGAPAGVVAAAALICSALPSALALPAAPDPAGSRPAASITSDLLAGVRVILRSRGLSRATTTSVVSCAGQGMLIACVPLLGESLGAAGHGAILLSVTAASALAANAVLARRPRLLAPDTVIWCSTVVLAVALVLLAIGRPALLIAAMVIAGIGEGPQLTALFAVRHREAPGRLRGQVFTTGASLKITGFALGAGVAGPLADRSLPGALLAAAGVQVLAALCFAWHSRAHRRVRRAGAGDARRAALPDAHGRVRT
ncbi:integral membrane protein [Planomonospora sphaerica]|uniref:Integral membrane protein n=1 Tax=Planomonospora sphaerica TaxID=161355 RepID=A0A161LUX4_9ACTN|nr:integral membrane protein [Planomonospora sphaerica]